MSKKEPHAWHYGKKMKMTWCRKCGLIPLNNDATKKAIEAACPDDKDV